MTPLAELARAMFAAAVSAVRPEVLMRQVEFHAGGIRFREDELAPAGRLLLVALGKAAPGLAAAFLTRSLRRPDEVFILAPDGVAAGNEVARFVRRASHPLPDARGVAATEELIATLTALSPADGVVLLLSGGASALLAAPVAGISAEAVTSITKRLLDSGAGIRELNTVRKRLLAASGGRLAASCPAEMMTLAVSDVPGDDLAVIASGPSVPDASDAHGARDVLARHGLAGVFAEVDALLERLVRAAAADTPRCGDPRLARGRAWLLGCGDDALAEAARVAREAGFAPLVLGARLHGEARFQGHLLGQLAETLAPADPVALLLRGETTVTVRGGGQGGRNLELALAAAMALAGLPERCLLAASTDGVDGTSPAAGAVVDGGTVARARSLGREPLAALADNDGWGFFAGLPEAIVTGPTGTNVADLAFVIAAGRPRTFFAASVQPAYSVPVAPASPRGAGDGHPRYTGER